MRGEGSVDVCFGCDDVSFGRCCPDLELDTIWKGKKRDIPYGGSWKSFYQSCKEEGKGDRIDVGSTCPSPTRQLQDFNLSTVVGKIRRTSASCLPLSLKFSNLSSTIGLFQSLKKAQSPFLGNTPSFFPFLPLFPPFFWSFLILAMNGSIVSSNSSSLPKIEECRMRRETRVNLHCSGSGVGCSVGM